MVIALLYLGTLLGGMFKWVESLETKKKKIALDSTRVSLVLILQT